MEFYRPDTLQGALEALDNVYRALRAWKFYPIGHPIRKSSIRQAHASLQAVLDGSNLSLICGSTGFTLPDREPVKNTTQLSAALSYEFFIRRIHKITFLNDLHQDDLLDLLRIVAQPPDDLQQAGGVDALLTGHGVRTIWVNELDLATIRARRQRVEESGIVPQGVDELENDISHEAPEIPETTEAERGTEKELRALLARIAATRDAELYLMLARQAVSCAEVIKSRHDLALLLPMIVLLADHAQDMSRDMNLVTCARHSLARLTANTEMISYLLDRVAVSGGIAKSTMLTVLGIAGSAGIRLTVEKLAEAESLGERKILTILLQQIGEPAVEPIVLMMGDRRWHVVRNLAAVLGDIGSPAAVDGLQGILLHSDLRVSKEAIRSLAKIGGKDAETAITSVLHDKSSPLFSQAVASLGGMKSRTALTALMQIVEEKSLLLPTLPQKLEALSAIAMIGDNTVVPSLAKVLKSRHLLARSRWNQYKSAVAACLGKLGDARALPDLEKLARQSGELGRTCAAAIESIRQAESVT